MTLVQEGVKVVYSQPCTKFLGSVGWGALLLYLAFAVLVFGFVAEEIGPVGKEPGPASVLIIRVLCFTGVASFGALGFGILLVAVLGRNNRVEVVPDGLNHVCRGRSSMHHWDDLQSVWWQEHIISKAGQIHSSFRLEFNNGRSLRFSNTVWTFPRTVLCDRQVSDLRKTVHQELCRRKLPHVLALYDADKTVPFGELAVNRQGLTWKGKVVTWPQIEGLQFPLRPILKLGSLRWALVTTGGEQLKFRLQTIPNLALLWALIDKIRGLSTEHLPA